MIIEGEGKKCDKAGWARLPYGFDIRYIPNGGVFFDTCPIIKVKGTGKGISIYQDAQNHYERQPKQGHALVFCK
jgi:hypothetical protein